MMGWPSAHSLVMATEYLVQWAHWIQLGLEVLQVCFVLVERFLHLKKVSMFLLEYSIPLPKGFVFYCCHITDLTQQHNLSCTFML